MNNETVQVATSYANTVVADVQEASNDKNVTTATQDTTMKCIVKEQQTSPESTVSAASTLVPENAWKVVGSPARRASISGASLEATSPPPGVQKSDLLSTTPPTGDKVFNGRSRAASVSLFPVDAEHAPPGLAEIKEFAVTTSSIWSSNSNNGSPKSDVDQQNFFMRANSNGSPEIAVLTEEEYNNIPKGRSRSKSSSAIFGFGNEGAALELEDTLPDMSSIWMMGAKQQNLKSASSGADMHRRASTQPSQQTLMWEALRAAQLATPSDMNGNHTDELLERFKREQQALNLRRYSVAPSMVNRFMKRNVQDAPLEEEDEESTTGNNGSSNNSVLRAPSSFEHHTHQFEGRRRHSMAGPVFDRKLNTKFLSEGFEALGLDNASKQLEKIDDYFENTESRTRAFREAGKNLQANQDIVSPILRTPEEPEATHTWPLYVVEFKAGRTDYFYLPSDLSHVKISVGDLAIVEADRGKDLGKVIEVDIKSMNELRLYQATHEDPLVDSHNAVGKEIQPKRLFRLAEPSEVAMLLQKGQDEAKANSVCQVKIRQKKLPMEIVDAEYQWDRRKLTFYFVADRRIDFRELVRELFKIYKTRIWMCAVQPTSQL